MNCIFNLSNTSLSLLYQLFSLQNKGHDIFSFMVEVSCCFFAHPFNILQSPQSLTSQKFFNLFNINYL